MMINHKYYAPDYADVKGLFPDKEQFELHINLYKKYITKVDDENDTSQFAQGGKLLHHLYFEQFRQMDQFKKPYGQILEFIEKHFDTYDKFKEKFIEVCNDQHGSNWVYLSKTGKIKTIPNHKKVNDVVLIVDMWEHAWQASDSLKEKDKYLNNIWKYLAWDIIQSRLPLMESDTMRHFMKILD